MSFLEYLVTIDINPDSEEKTKVLIDNINRGVYPFYINYYYDKTVNNKNLRYFNISSYQNIDYIVYQLFNRSLLNIETFYKTPVYLY